MNQTKLESLIEVFFNYLSGFLLAWAVYAWIIIPNDELKNSAFTATCIFTTVSILRTYFWRRFFNAGLHKLVHRVLTQLLNHKGDNNGKS